MCVVEVHSSQESAVIDKEGLASAKQEIDFLRFIGSLCTSVMTKYEVSISKETDLSLGKCPEIMTT